MEEPYFQRWLDAYLYRGSPAEPWAINMRPGSRLGLQHQGLQEWWKKKCVLKAAQSDTGGSGHRVSRAEGEPMALGVRDGVG